MLMQSASEATTGYKIWRIYNGSSAEHLDGVGLKVSRKSKYSRCTKLWHDLPSISAEAVELQKFKLGANALLLCVD